MKYRIAKVFKKSLIFTLFGFYFHLIPGFSQSSSLLLNGPRYKYRYPNAEGHQYLNGQAMHFGKLIYEGVDFPNVEINYDVYNDVIFTSYNEEDHIKFLILDSKRVEGLYLNDQYFIYVGDNLYSGVPSGIYEQVYLQDSLIYLRKRAKKLLKSSNSTGDKFIQNDAHYLIRNKEACEIKNKKDLLACLGNEKNIKSFMIKNKLKLKVKGKSFRDEVVKILTFLENF